MYENNRDEINFHKFLKSVRTSQGVTLEKTTFGIGTKSGMSRVEAGNRLPGKLVRDRLTARLGISGEEYEEYLLPSEYNQWQHRMEIMRCINKKDAAGAEEKINEYDKAYNKNRVERQFVATMRFMVYQLKGASEEVLRAQIHDALVCTVPNIDAAFAGIQLLADQELNLIMEYVRLAETDGEHTATTEWRLKEYHKIVTYVDNSRMDKIAQAKVYSKAACFISELVLTDYVTEKSLRYALGLCTHAIEVLRDTVRLYYFVELNEYRMKLIEKLRSYVDAEAGGMKDEAAVVEADDMSVDETAVEAGDKNVDETAVKAGEMKDDEATVEAENMNDVNEVVVEAGDMNVDETVVEAVDMNDVSEVADKAGNTEDEAVNLDELYQTSREWAALFHEMYTENEVPVYMENFTHLYTETECNNALEVIRIRRAMMGVSRAKFCGYACSERTLQRIELGQNNSSMATVREVFDRMGICAEYKRARVVTSSADALHLSEKLIIEMNSGEYDKAFETYGELCTKIDMNIPFNEQEMRRVEAHILRMTGEVTKEQHREMLIDIIECTVALDTLMSEGEKYLTRTELSCVLDFARYTDGKETIYCKDYLENMCMKILNLEDIEIARLCVYELIMSKCANIMGNEGKYKESSKISRKLLKESLRNRRMFHLMICEYNIFWNYQKIMELKNAQIDDTLIFRSLNKGLSLSNLARKTDWKQFFQQKLHSYAHEIMDE